MPDGKQNERMGTTGGKNGDQQQQEWHPNSHRKWKRADLVIPHKLLFVPVGTEANDAAGIAETSAKRDRKEKRKNASCKLVGDEHSSTTLQTVLPKPPLQPFYKPVESNPENEEERFAPDYD